MEIKKTITSIFMVPTLQIPREELKSNEFINGYIRDVRRDVQYPNSIYLLFKPININKFRIFLDKEYERTKMIIEDYNYEDGYVVVVYKLDPTYEKDFKLIREGKYSKTSRPFQVLFPKIVTLVKNGLKREEICLQYRVFNKTVDLVQFWEEKFGVEFNQSQELWDGFREDEEILDLDKFKEYARHEG